jgi:hypothetical protein
MYADNFAGEPHHLLRAGLYRYFLAEYDPALGRAKSQ